MYTSENSSSHLQTAKMIEVQNIGFLNLADADADLAEEPVEEGFWGKVGDGAKDLGQDIEEWFEEDVT